MFITPSTVRFAGPYTGGMQRRNVLAGSVAESAAMPRCVHGRKLRLGCSACRGESPNSSATLAVCMPMRSGMTRETQSALQQNMDGIRYDLLTSIGKDVVTARNELAARALDRNAPYVLWSDSDAWWPAGTVRRMLNTIERRSDIDVLAGYFGGRDHFSPAFCWRDFNTENTWSNAENFVDPGRNCALGDVVRIEKTGCHFLLMRREALERVGPAPFTLITPQWSEDFALMFRALHARLGLFVDTGAIVAHIDDQGRAHVPGYPPGQIVHNKLVHPRVFERPTGPRQLGPERSYGLPTYGA